MGWKYTEAQVKAIGLRRPNKYGAKKAKIDGYTFDSQAEARRYRELRLNPEIRELKVHPRFPIVINEKKVCDVVLDFHYRIGGWYYFEDIKGCDTAMSRLKRKMVEAAYGIKVDIRR